MIKNVLVALVVLAVAVTGVYGFAAGISVTGVDNLGSGEGVVSPTADVDDVSYTLSEADCSCVDGVVLSFNDPLAGKTLICVQLTQGGVIIADIGTSDVEVDVGGLNTGDPITVPFNPCVPADIITDIHVTVIEPA